MEREDLADVELKYTALETLDFGAGGQIYGTMDGSLSPAQRFAAVDEPRP